jgi:hypothetical protein
MDESAIFGVARVNLPTLHKAQWKCGVRRNHCFSRFGSPQSELSDNFPILQLQKSKLVLREGSYSSALILQAHNYDGEGRNPSEASILRIIQGQGWATIFTHGPELVDREF